jgi:mannonate dehydratase
MHRRKILKNLGLGLSAGLVTNGLAARDFAAGGEKVDAAFEGATRGMPPLEITGVKAIATAPNGIELIVVKVETSEPGLVGYGCATFRQRARSVVSAIDEYLPDFCIGRDPANIEDLWQTAYVSSYWRNGPVLNNALSGLDQALWDIKAKRANMPLYDLLGGKCRFAIPCYSHAGGRDHDETIESVRQKMAEGYRHIRIQLGGYGALHLAEQPDFKEAGFGRSEDNFMDQNAYMRGVPAMFDAVRSAVGPDVELLHDIHERLDPMDAIQLVKDLEPYRPFFVEDPFSPQDVEWFALLREQTTVPLAMGELFNNPNEWVRPMADRLFDYIRIHISQIGGITPAMKTARLGEFFGVKTAWHGPGDVSPVGHAANAHIDYAVWNFGIQEAVNFPEETREVFPGHPVMIDGYMHVNDAPGLGVEVNEEAAAKYPLPNFDYGWTQVRKRDGTAIRP